MKLKDIKVESGVKQRLQHAELIQLVESGKIEIREEIINKIEGKYEYILRRGRKRVHRSLYERDVKDEYKQYKEIMGKDRKILTDSSFSKMLDEIIYAKLDGRELSIPKVNPITKEGIDRFVLKEIEKLNIRKRIAQKELDERKAAGKNGKVDFELGYKIEKCKEFKEALIELRDKYME